MGEWDSWKALGSIVDGAAGICREFVGICRKGHVQNLQQNAFAAGEKRLST